MRILIVSDTHGKTKGLDAALSAAGEIDLLIHLGDIEGDEDDIQEAAGCDTLMVAGNNDFFTELDGEILTEIEGKKFFLTHGHYYSINYGNYDEIARAARDRGADYVLFGHTHRPYYEERGGVTLINPGSLSLPRQQGRQPSYAVMELAEGRDAYVEICYL